MCIVVPGKVTKITGKKAVIQYDKNIVREALIADIQPSVGEFVLVQMGIIIRKISEKEMETAGAAWGTLTS
jgi:hydrogenase assembly chaperone HypC/HupF